MPLSTITPEQELLDAIRVIPGVNVDDGPWLPWPEVAGNLASMVIAARQEIVQLRAALSQAQEDLRLAELKVERLAGECVGEKDW